MRRHAHSVANTVTVRIGQERTFKTRLAEILSTLHTLLVLALPSYPRLDHVKHRVRLFRLDPEKDIDGQKSWLGAQLGRTWIR